MSAVTILQARRTRAVGFLSNKNAEVHRVDALTFDELTAMLTDVKVGKKDGAGWIPADIAPGRRLKEHVKSLSWLVLDVEARSENLKGDDGEPLVDEHGDKLKRVIGPPAPEIDELTAELELLGWRAFLHTSYSHTPEHPRYRVVFDVSRAMTPTELETLTIHLTSLLGLSDCYDAGSIEANRFYYLPRCPESRLESFQCRLTSGEPLPIDTLLRDAENAQEALRKAVERASQAVRRKRGPVIDAFNQAHDVGQILERHGYVSRGRGRWLHPDSTTGDPGVRLLPDSHPARVFSSHGNCVLNDGHAHDAFDAYRLLEHGGDIVNAVKEAARVLNIDNRPASKTSTIVDSARYLQTSPMGDTEEQEAEPLSTRFRPISIEELLAQDEPGWLVHGVLPRVGVAQLLGESHAGKTFAALHLSAAVAQGVPWFNRDIDEPACVVYVSGEGSLRRRVRAHLKHHQVSPSALQRLRFLERAVNLLDGKQVDELLVYLHELKLQFNGLGLVVLDTYARMTPGGDEGRQDTGLAVSTCDRLRDELGCCVLLLHHPGYSNLERGRGHSSLYAALDTEINLTATSKGRDAVRTLTLTKNRDEEADKVFGAFRLEVLELELDAKARPVTSCAVVPLEDDEIPATPARRQKLTPREVMLIQALHDELDVRESRITSNVEHIRLGAHEGQHLAREKGVRDRFYAKLGDDVDSDNRRKVYARARDNLVAKKYLGSAEGVLWLVD